MREKQMNCNDCKNYEPKLPKITIKEVGLKYWELANENGENACKSTKEYFKISDPMNCEEMNCASHECFKLFVRKINKLRGYSND